MKIASLGFGIYGLSPDSPAINTTFKRECGLPFTLLCDPLRDLSQWIGLATTTLTHHGVFVINKAGEVLSLTQCRPVDTLFVMESFMNDLSSLSQENTKSPSDEEETISEEQNQDGTTQQDDDNRQRVPTDDKDLLGRSHEHIFKLDVSYPMDEPWYCYFCRRTPDSTGFKCVGCNMKVCDPCSIKEEIGSFEILEDLIGRETNSSSTQLIDNEGISSQPRQTLPPMPIWPLQDPGSLSVPDKPSTLAKEAPISKINVTGVLPSDHNSDFEAEDEEVEGQSPNTAFPSGPVDTLNSDALSQITNSIPTTVRFHGDVYNLLLLIYNTQLSFVTGEEQDHWTKLDIYYTDIKSINLEKINGIQIKGVIYEIAANGKVSGCYDPDDVFFFALVDPEPGHSEMIVEFLRQKTGLARLSSMLRPTPYSDQRIFHIKLSGVSPESSIDVKLYFSSAQISFISSKGAKNVHWQIFYYDIKRLHVRKQEVFEIEMTTPLLYQFQSPADHGRPGPSRWIMVDGNEEKKVMIAATDLQSLNGIVEVLEERVGDKSLWVYDAEDVAVR